MSETTTTPTTPTRINKAALIRSLLRAGKTKDEAAAEAGCDVQYVYGVVYAEKQRKRLLKAKRKQEIRKGAPKRAYIKTGKYAKKDESPVVESVVGEVRYVQVDVPQPHYDLTWKQRFTALFFGRV
jgi:hypothetical protein